MDCLRCSRPLPKSSAGHQFILVLIDYTTLFPDANPLCTVMGPCVAEELLKWVVRVWILKEIIMDQGPNFMSHVMRNLCMELKICHLRMAAYHPQTNRLVERFNSTLKNMLCQCTQEAPRKWDLLVPPLLFAVREALQFSLGVTPFELVYRHEP